MAPMISTKSPPPMPYQIDSGIAVAVDIRIVVGAAVVAEIDDNDAGIPFVAVGEDVIIDVEICAVDVTIGLEGNIVVMVGAAVDSVVIFST